ncbi:MAG: tRNA (adenosine(37)-N6)-dimethylallyltransferase MiaA [Bacteroidales bacterium]|nr:tRNA (adenosine(37)-N6)-dimethylallyltransferase MiaA [Bacteroidales bacterium]HOY39836.1 tRNA (adenosine(37)-N6)-dimethylallyltransferase MiaA [Bacteroidales bacterium]
MHKNKLVCLLGPTAGGKTKLAAWFCERVGGEIISADSRQVYRGMDIGTGKDISDYYVEGMLIPYHLIDIRNPGEKYNIFEFANDFKRVYKCISDVGKLPVLCGGSGLYIESVIGNYQLLAVPTNDELRKKLQGKTLQELGIILSTYKKLHNHTDTDTIKRAIRAIEIADYEKLHGKVMQSEPEFNNLIFGIAYDRETRRERITARLKERLGQGLLEEGRQLLQNGLSLEDMEYYGLEYKYMALHLSGRLSLDEMAEKLNTAIHQFAKRQMTWFRRMERNGVKIHWIDPNMNFDKKLTYMLTKYQDTFC